MNNKLASLEYEKLMFSPYNRQSHLLLGHKQYRFNWQNIQSNSSSLFVGAIGTGKSVASYSTWLHYALTNPNDLIIIFDAKRMIAPDYSAMFELPLVWPILSNTKDFLSILNLVYLEALKRKENLEKVKLSNIHLVIEEADEIFRMLNLSVPNHPDSSKFIFLLKEGGKLGITITCTTEYCNENLLTTNTLSLFKNKLVFKVDNNTSAFLQSPDSSKIRSDEKGQAFSNLTKEKLYFPYIEKDKTQGFISAFKQDSYFFSFIFTKEDINNFKENPSLLSSKLLWKEFWNFIEKTSEFS